MNELTGPWLCAGTRACVTHMLAVAAAMAVATGVADGAQGLPAAGETGRDAPVQTPWGTVAEPAWPAKVCTTLAAAYPRTLQAIDALDADPTHSQPDTARVQRALDVCEAGNAVRLAPGPNGEGGFLSGPLSLPSGVTLWIDAGVTLYASRNPADFDTGNGECGTASLLRERSCRPLLSARGTVRSGVVGDGAIDGRGGSVVTTGRNAGRRSWWDVAWQNKSEGLTQHNPQLLRVEGGSDFTLHRITLLNAPQFNVVTDGVSGVTAWRLKILTPSAEYTQSGYACPPGTTPDVSTPATCFTPDTVKNTDGFDPGQSDHVLLAHAWISTGDDHVAIKSHGKRATHDLAFIDNQFHYGHGLSIGSETDAGVYRVWVDRLAIDGHGSPNGIGLRIKSDATRGGEVRGIEYHRICLRDVRQPLVFDSFYGPAAARRHLPWFHDVVVQDLHDVSRSVSVVRQLSFAGDGADTVRRPLQIRLDNVVLDGDAPVVAKRHNGSPSQLLTAAHIVLGPGIVTFSELLREHRDATVTITGATGKSVPLDCSRAFAASASGGLTLP